MSYKNKIDLDNAIGLLIKSTSKSIEKSLDFELHRKCGLSSGQWKVIGALAIQNGLTQSKIAEMVFVETPTLVPILDKMEKDGWVERKADPSDRRNNNIFLTKKAEGSLVESVIDSVLGIRKMITKDITHAELEVTKKTLRQIMGNAESFLEKNNSKNMG
ncbi:MAG TPA: MarR family transcriptional regulator [Nitrosopumilaceae archaeon]|nr:MarR family transcriptional regulator [Nitrosopumilaceae archaeon]